MSINQLPTETHTLILDFLASFAQPEPEALRFRTSTFPRVFRSPSLFPWNAASTCKLWRDILARIPGYWTRVALDVAYDPAPLIDVFRWTQNLEDAIDVVVFNSTEELDKADKVVEQQRAAAIATALLPNVDRCRRILFYTVFSSSLPPPHLFLRQDARRLEELCLDCKIDDIETENYSEPTTSEKIQDNPSFPVLRELSLTGFWFLHLVSYTCEPSQWLQKFGHDMMDIRLSMFSFREEGHYSLRNLGDNLSKMGVLSTIHLDNLSLAHADIPSACCVNPSITYHVPQIMSFSRVSRGLLSLFSRLILNAHNSHSHSGISFRRCEIPPIDNLPDPSTLIFTNIMDDELGTSLRNAMANRAGGILQFYECPSFNNAFLKWLSEPTAGANNESHSNKEFPANGLRGIVIKDCNNFSSGALREMIESRNAAICEMAQQEADPSDAQAEIRARGGLINSLAVFQGKGGAVLSEEDGAWFEKNLPSFFWGESPTA